jgi:(R,R)-butanediol dehydrogenase/meso-butanediol dehydrogenase/diacetyl reductase
MTDEAEPQTRMRAAVYHGKHDVRLEEVEAPSPGPGEVLLRVETVGVCGTDAAEWAYGPTQFPLYEPHPVTGHVGPLVIGHEFSGVVIGVGDGVDSGWLGALVASCGAAPCGSCALCTAGRSNQCARYSAVGLHRAGALAELVTTPLESCVRVDEAGITADEAALAQPLAIAVHVAGRGRVRTDDRAVVFGVGGIGAFLVHVLAQREVEVVAVDLDDERLAVARDLGATWTVRAPAGSTEIRAALDADPDVVFEVTGSPAALRDALALVPVGGRLVLVGVQKMPVEVLLAPVTLREQEIIGTNALLRESDLPAAVDLLAVRRGRWALVAPVVLPMHSLVAGALEPMAAGRAPAIKTLIDPRAGVPRSLNASRPSGS